MRSKSFLFVTTCFKKIQKYLQILSRNKIIMREAKKHGLVKRLNVKIRALIKKLVVFINGG